MRAAEAGGRSADYLRGYREAVLHLTDTVAGGEAAATAGAVIAAVDESQATWGLQVDQGRQLLPHRRRACASRCSTPASTWGIPTSPGAR